MRNEKKHVQKASEMDISTIGSYNDGVDVCRMWEHCKNA